MPNLLLPLALFTVVLGIQNIQATSNCYLGHYQYYMKWVDSDGSLIFPEYLYGFNGQGFSDDNSSESSTSETDEVQDIYPQWSNIGNSNSCMIDDVNNILICQGNTVKHLPPPKSVKINNIKQYIVTFASLAPLPPSNFEGLKIRDLIILNSSLTFISEDVFRSIKSLSTLTIRGNNITTLNSVDKIFKDMSSIKAIYLEANKLRNLNCIDNKSKILENVEFLSLAYNPLALINFHCFSQSKLIYLNLKGVQIDDVQAQSMELSSLPKTLTTVDLSFSTISSEALKTVLYMLNSHNITKLSLANLNLITFPFDALTYSRSSLRYLSLKGNIFDDNTFYSRMETSDKYPELKELDLRSCRIEVINSVLFDSFPNLQMLTLTDNNLHMVESTLLTFSPFLNYLDISQNSETLTFSYAINENAQNSNTTSALKVLNLSKNVFNSTQSWLAYNMTLQLLTNLEVLSLCSTTLSVENVNAMSNLINLSRLDLSYTLVNNRRSSLISALKNLFPHLNRLTELQFVNNEFKFKNESEVFFTSLTSLKLLNLSDNSIDSLSDKMFFNLSNLEELIMHENSIASWTSTIFPNNTEMEKLDLSHNLITFISDTMVEDFRNLKTLNLKSNQLVCNKLTNYLVCGVKVEFTQLNVVDWEDYVCMDLERNKYVPYVNSSLCSESKTLPTSNKLNTIDNSYAIPILLISILALLLVVIGTITKMNWWQIKNYIVLVKQKGGRFIPKKNNLHRNNQPFMYDVFVSYSDIDRAWVLDHLIPFIERESNMNVCFHERDFQVGMSILENIIESMAKSRCLLLVISESFVKSRWCQFEMHLAQHHAVETKKEQLVMVLLENIPKKNRPKTLHHLMCTRTYLIWPTQQSKEDAVDLFWKRLLRAIKYETALSIIY